MALSLTCTRGGTSANYIKYLTETNPTKSDRVNEPDLLDFTLASTDDPAFVKLVAGDYIKFQTDTYGLWFTGYITNTPEPEFVGSKNHTGRWIYRYEATSDEVILNKKPLGHIPPYINETQGGILKDLVVRLGYGGLFDTSGILDGHVVPEYRVDATKKYQDIVKEFGDVAMFKFNARDHVLTFKSQDADPAGIVIDGNDPHFTPKSLKISTNKDPLLNDVAIFGGVEPQAYISEYHVGDGFEALFTLLSGVYGLSKYVRLDEVFSGTDIDQSKWLVNDPSGGTTLELSNGYLNCVGGSDDGSYDTYLRSQNAIPLEGHLRLTHGEWDFLVPGNANLMALWLQEPNAAMTGLLYGLAGRKSGGNMTLSPVVAGVIDTSQVFTISDFNKRYVIRTIVTFERMNRFTQNYSYVAADGTIGTYGGTGYEDVPVFHTMISVIEPDPLSPQAGEVIKKFEMTSYGPVLATTELSAFYSPLMADDLHATVTSITLSTPLQASLEVLEQFLTETKYSVGTYVRPRLPNGHFYITTVEGVSGTDPDMIWPTTTGATVVSGTATFTEVGTSMVFNKKLIGPNEIDAQDGLAPVATISNAAGGAQDNQDLRALRYNPGACTLQYFKATKSQETNVPKKAALIHINYRRAGVAVAHVQDPASITAQASAWGDSGHRASVITDMSPAPRTSEECEMAAAAVIKDSNHEHYEGSYTLESPFSFTAEPKAGSVLTFQNLPADTFPGIQAEIVKDVSSIILTAKGRIGTGSPVEIFQHTLNFGRPDITREVVDKIEDSRTAFLPQDTAEIPVTIPVADVGTTYAPDVTAPTLQSWARTTLTYNTGQTAPIGGGFEVRYTDYSWGTDPAKNLAIRTSSSSFTVPRNARGKVVFIRAYDASGNYSRFSAVVRAGLPDIPPAPTYTINLYDQAAPVLSVILPTIQKDVWGYEVRGDDDVTVLKREDLTEAGAKLQYIAQGNSARDISYHVYTYNILGEYSDDINATHTILTPTVENVTVNDDTMNVEWIGHHALGYIMEVDATDGTMKNLVLSATTPDQVFHLPEVHFFQHRWISVTPYDETGKGTPEIYEHQYVPKPVISFDSDEIITVVPSQAPAPPVQVVSSGFQTDYINASIDLIKTTRYFQG